MYQNIRNFQIILQSSIMLKSLFNVTCKSLNMFSTSATTCGKLSGKVAVVTASSEGIGFSIAKKLGIDGAHVVISSRNIDKVNNAVDNLKAEINDIQVSGIQCHVGKESDRKSLLEMVKSEHGRIDMLVSNTGVNPYYGNILDTPESAYDKIFDINVKSTFLLIKEAVPLIKNSQNGSIVIVSSIAGFNPLDLLGIYSVSKTALIGLTKALTPELARMNIRINCLAPGIIKTKFSKALWENPSVSQGIEQQVPLQRLAEPDECSGIVSFLGSDDASYITGETFVVAGGMQSRL